MGFGKAKEDERQEAPERPEKAASKGDTERAARESKEGFLAAKAKKPALPAKKTTSNNNDCSENDGRVTVSKSAGVHLATEAKAVAIPVASCTPEEPVVWEDAGMDDDF